LGGGGEIHSQEVVTNPPIRASGNLTSSEWLGIFENVYDPLPVVVF
jgi:hypothetical protein